MGKRQSAGLTESAGTVLLSKGWGTSGEVHYVGSVNDDHDPDYSRGHGRDHVRNRDREHHHGRDPRSQMGREGLTKLRGRLAFLCR